MDENNLIQKGKRSILQIIFGRSTLIVVMLLLNFSLFFSFRADCVRRY